MDAVLVWKNKADKGQAFLNGIASFLFFVGKPRNSVKCEGTALLKRSRGKETNTKN